MDKYKKGQFTKTWAEMKWEELQFQIDWQKRAELMKKRKKNKKYV